MTVNSPQFTSQMLSPKNDVHIASRDTQYTPPTPTRLNCRVNCVHTRRCLPDSPKLGFRVRVRGFGLRLAFRRNGFRRIGTEPTSRLSWPSLQFCSLYVTGAENWKLGHDWRLVRSHRRHDATRLRCRQIVQPRRDSSRLSPTSCEFNTHRRRRRNSTWQLSCVGVGGVYWA